MAKRFVTTILPKPDKTYIGFVQVECDGMTNAYYSTGRDRVAVLRKLNKLAANFFNTVRDSSNESQKVHAQ